MSSNTDSNDQQKETESTQQAVPYEEGKENSHQAHDPKDQRSIANRLAAADDQNDDNSGKNLSAEDKAAQIDPTLPAKMHGNEPSRGAVIDKQIEDEEAEIIAKMDAKKAAKK